MELFHLCAEANTTGASTPTLEDVISMVLEDILNVGGSSTTTLSQESTRQRSLHTSVASPLHNRRRALRAHHLPRNRFIRPRRLSTKTRGQRRLEESNLISDLMDDVAVSGGYDGEKVSWFQQRLFSEFCSGTYTTTACIPRYLPSLSWMSQSRILQAWTR